MRVWFPLKLKIKLESEQSWSHYNDGLKYYQEPLPALIWVFSPQRSHRFFNMCHGENLNCLTQDRRERCGHTTTVSAMYNPQFARNFESVVTGSHLAARKLILEENICLFSQNMLSRETKGCTRVPRVTSWYLCELPCTVHSALDSGAFWKPTWKTRTTAKQS